MKQATLWWWIGPPIAMFAVAVFAIVWLMLASVVFIAEAHLFSVVRWPDALGYWWSASARPRYADMAQRSGWLALEIETVVFFILGCSWMGRLRRGVRQSGPFMDDDR